MSDSPARGIEVAGQRQPLAQRHHVGMAHPEPTRSNFGTSGQPPRATIPSKARIACSVCCTVAGDSVGSDAFGIWMVREPESKPWPKSRVEILIDQRLQGGILRKRPRRQQSAAGESGRARELAQHGAAVETIAFIKSPNPTSGRPGHKSVAAPVRQVPMLYQATCSSG